MHFVIYCKDKPGHGDLRVATRPRHLAYLDGFKDRMFAAGGLLTDDGKAAIGSLLILDFPDRAAAEAFAAGDPYNTAGLFESVDVNPWRKVLPAE